MPVTTYLDYCVCQLLNTLRFRINTILIEIIQLEKHFIYLFDCLI